MLLKTKGRETAWSVWWETYREDQQQLKQVAKPVESKDSMEGETMLNPESCRNAKSRRHICSTWASAAPGHTSCWDVHSWSGFRCRNTQRGRNSGNLRLDPPRISNRAMLRKRELRGKISRMSQEATRKTSEWTCPCLSEAKGCRTETSFIYLKKAFLLKMSHAWMFAT